MSDTSKFDIHHKTTDKVECLYLNGFLDAYTAPKLETTISKLVDSGKKNILVNFRDLDYISSAGLGVFMAFIEDIRNTGGDIKFTEMKPKVFSVFDLLGFPLLFDIDVEEAETLKKFQESADSNE